MRDFGANEFAGLDVAEWMRHRAWRECVFEAVRELWLSAGRRRTMSLGNVSRLFERRWAAVGRGAEWERGRVLGRDFLRSYYLRGQPFVGG